MKKIILFITLITFGIAVYAQSANDQVSTIKKQFAIINSDTAYKKVTLENEDFLTEMTDGGGVLTGYYKGGEIKKINEWVGVSNGVYITEYYFKKRELIFAYTSFSTYYYDEKKDQFIPGKKELTSEVRYYFQNKHLIDHKEKQLRASANQVTSEDSNNIISAAADDLKMLDKKMKR